MSYLFYQLGQSALKKFGKFTFNYSSETLILGETEIKNNSVQNNSEVVQNKPETINPQPETLDWKTIAKTGNKLALISKVDKAGEVKRNIESGYVMMGENSGMFWQPTEDVVKCSFILDLNIQENLLIILQEKVILSTQIQIKFYLLPQLSRLMKSIHVKDGILFPQK